MIQEIHIKCLFTKPRLHTCFLLLKKKRKRPAIFHAYVHKLQKIKTKRVTKLSRHNTAVMQICKVKSVKPYPASLINNLCDEQLGTIWWMVKVNESLSIYFRNYIKPLFVWDCGDTVGSLWHYLYCHLILSESTGQSLWWGLQ